MAGFNSQPSTYITAKISSQTVAYDSEHQHTSPL